MKDAKGHGSNPRGAHAAGTNQVGNIALHPKVLSTINRNPSGFSVKPSSGSQPRAGFMVSLPGRTQIVSADDLRGPHGRAILEQYARAHSDVLSQPGAHLGGWTDKTSGKTYLDVSHNIKTRDAAVKAGRAQNQIAIFDVRRRREIRTGGTGA